MNIDRKELGENISNIRKGKFIDLEKLSIDADVPIELIKKYENANIDDVDINIIERISKALDVEISYLTGWKGDSLGEIIKYRRKELGMTQRDVANHVNVSHSAVSRWESGEIENITQDKVADLAEILQLSPLTLLAPNSNNDLYKIRQEYLDIAKRLQALNIPLDICEQILDILQRLKDA